MTKSPLFNCRMLIARIAPLALLAGLACARADRTITAPVDAGQRLAGTWAENIAIRGSSLVMTVAASDTVVTGTGTYAIEAGRSGTLTVQGSVTAAHVALDLAFDYGTTAHFAGQPPADSTLSGELQYFQVGTTTSPAPVTFRRRN